jgi:hypothetical protein
MLTRRFPSRTHLLAALLALVMALAGCATSSAPTAGPSMPAPDEPASSAAPSRGPAADQEIRVSPVRLDDYLTNPGMGWQDGPEHHGKLGFPETVAYANRRDIAWSELNPAPGVYAWAVLDAQLEQAVADGKQFSFRVYTTVGEGYDGDKIPEWVVAEGARILPGGEPDYASCVYQEAWGTFVNELIRVYDGDPNVAFIDISGYGNFNEWNWHDQQTEWDFQWERDYANGSATAASFTTLDGQARRRLVDMFIGGAFDGHTCRMPDGSTAQVDYAYRGFQRTQLIMPYAGIVQSTQYVASRRGDVGFRYDCLGRDGEGVFDKVGGEILCTWKNAPVVYEMCGPDEASVQDATWLLRQTHGSLVHNNNWEHSLAHLEEMMQPVGYRYALKDVIFRTFGRQMEVEMQWQNLGLAPSYPRMGQDLRLNIYLINRAGRVAFEAPVAAQIHTWLPADPFGTEAPAYLARYAGEIPAFLEAGDYQVGVAIIERRTGLPVQLAMPGRDANGIYVLFSVKIR